MGLFKKPKVTVEIDFNKKNKSNKNLLNKPPIQELFKAIVKEEELVKLKNKVSERTKGKIKLRIGQRGNRVQRRKRKI